jgi:hypothetical protein
VVTEEHHDRALRELVLVEGVEQPAHLRVHETDAGVVGVQELAPLLVRERVERVLERATAERERVRRLVPVGRFREVELAVVVEVEVLLRRLERVLRPVEADREEQRLVTLLPEQLHGFVRELAVGLFGVRATGRKPSAPRERPAGQVPALALVPCGGGLAVEHAIERLLVVHVRLRVVWRQATVEHLAQPDRLVSVLSEQFGERDRVREGLPKVRRVVHDAGGGQPQAREERGATRVAYGGLHVRAVESHPAGGEAMNVRRLHDLVAVAPEVAVQIVGDDEQDVRRLRQFRGVSGRNCRRERDEQEEGRITSSFAWGYVR